MSVGRHLGLISLALASTSCSIVVEGDEQQCSVAQDCADRGFVGAECLDSVCVAGASVDPRWACLGNLPEPMPQPGVVHTYRQRILKVVDQQVPANIDVDVCQILDVNCETPIVADIPADAEGRVEFEVDSGFEGYIQITSDETMPAMVFIGPPVTDDVEYGSDVQLVSQALLEAIVGLAGYTADPERGHALTLMGDCTGDTAAGVSLSIDVDDPDTVLFYLYDLQPDPNGITSDESGNGGYINIPPGYATISATLHETGQAITATRFHVRPSTIAYVPMLPTFLE